MVLQGICRKSGTNIIEALLESPIGLLKLRSCQTGLHSIEHDDQFNPNDENFTPNSKWNSSENTRLNDTTNVHLDKIIDWIQCYFRAPEKLLDELNEGKHEFCFPNSTEFEQEVLLTLYQDTKIGDKISYRELAEKVNRPNASRAVGTTMKKNPFPIIIPCHRVVRSDGSIGNYSGGKRNKIKEFLLNHEETLEK